MAWQHIRLYGRHELWASSALEPRLRNLPEPDPRQVALMKLEGYINREIADRLNCSERGIERKLNLIRKRREAGVEDLL